MQGLYFGEERGVGGMPELSGREETEGGEMENAKSQMQKARCGYGTPRSLSERTVHRSTR